MARVSIEIYEEESDEPVVSESSFLSESNEEEIAEMAFRVQRNYHNKLDKDSKDWDDF